MKIRNKILIYFSLTVTGLTMLSFVLIYFLFSEYREEEFQQEQFEKIKSTVRLIQEYQQKSEQISHLLDEQDINDFFDEKLQIYDQDKTLIFSSLDELKIKRPDLILHDLSPNRRWVEKQVDNYDVVGVYMVFQGKAYYAISKAFDQLGHSKRVFLGRLLLGMFAVFTLVVWGVSLQLSQLISRPLVQLSESMKTEGDLTKVKVNSTTLEIRELAEQFNALLQRIQEAFSFQKNSIHHISHQLKTPLAVLVTELDKMLHVENKEELKAQLVQVRDSTKSLGEVIHLLLEISKLESGQKLEKERFRMDELYFDTVEELQLIHPDARFELHYPESDFQEEGLYVQGNRLMMKQVLINVLSNGIKYSQDAKVNTRFAVLPEGGLELLFENQGETLEVGERELLFTAFFRGKNAGGLPGFGLGLALSKRIVEVHGGTLKYESKQANRFLLTLP